MLILFDIDGTLLRSGNAGRSAMCDAGRELFGPHFTLDGVEVAGRLDPLIYADAVRRCGVADGPSHHDRFRATYRDRLEGRLAERSVSALPGVADLLVRLGAMEDVELGLVTGNYPETGCMKLAAAGIDAAIFRANAFGSDGDHRRRLPVVAMERCRALRGAAVAAGDVVVIGDTPHDVDCARANGCRSIAVATGGTSRDELASHGAGLAVDDLSDTARLLGWMLDGRAS